MRKKRDHRELLRKAINTTGLADRHFAKTRLFVTERTLRNWKAGDSRIPGPVRVICQAMIDDPVAARALAKAAKKLQRTD